VPVTPIEGYHAQPVAGGGVVGCGRADNPAGGATVTLNPTREHSLHSGLSGRRETRNLEDRRAPGREVRCGQVEPCSARGEPGQVLVDPLHHAIAHTQGLENAVASRDSEVEHAQVGLPGVHEGERCSPRRVRLTIERRLVEQREHGWLHPLLLN
jgi:hypothetical protein